MISQGTKIHRGHLRRHSRCVRRTLRREIIFMNRDLHESAELPRQRRPVSGSSEAKSPAPGSVHAVEDAAVASRRE
jgi:hypothetical protein